MAASDNVPRDIGTREQRHINTMLSSGTCSLFCLFNTDRAQLYPHINTSNGDKRTSMLNASLMLLNKILNVKSFLKRPVLTAAFF